MYKKYKFVLITAIILGVIAIIVHLLHGVNFAVLNPKGVIAAHEKNLLIFTLLLSLVVVVPVFILLFLILWKYRESNTKATYSPEWDHNRFLEGMWWAIPCVIILILAVVTWTSSHELDPTRAIKSSAKPINIQVIALQWKWLFIYPDAHIATVNSLDIPVNTPINLELTADAPMNSFWIPSLGGQIYAMPGMSTHLNLMATSTGSYNGSSANISGEGFAGMKFVAKVTSAKDYRAWSSKLQRSSYLLNESMYNQLAKPSSNSPLSFYKLDDAYLYDKIVLKYMAPSDSVAGQK